MIIKYSKTYNILVSSWCKHKKYTFPEIPKILTKIRNLAVYIFRNYIYQTKNILWTFELGVLFKNYYFNIGIYVGMSMKGPRDKLHMSIHLITLPWVSKGAQINISYDYCTFSVIPQRKHGTF